MLSVLGAVLCVAAGRAEAGEQTVAYFTDGVQTHVMDAQSREVMRSLRTGTYPWRITVGPEGKDLWISDVRGETVYQVDVRQAQILKRHRGYVAVFGAPGYEGRLIGRGYMTAIIGPDEEPWGAHFFGRDVWSAGGARDMKMVYVMAHHVKGVHPFVAIDHRYKYLLEVDANSAQIVRRIDVGQDPFEVTRSPDYRYLLTANMGSGDVSVVPIASGGGTSRLEVGGRPRSVSITADGKRVTVCAEMLHLGGAASGPASPPSEAQAAGEDVAPAGRTVAGEKSAELPPVDAEASARASAAGSGQVHVFDATWEAPPRFVPVKVLEVDGAPECAEFSPDGRQLWVGTRNKNQIIIFDTTEWKELHRIARETPVLDLVFAAADESVVKKAGAEGSN